jgi:secretion/DNA translocation related TadE-like protein
VARWVRKRRPADWPAGDDGSGTVWVLALVVLLASSAVAVTLLLGVVAAHRRAVAAADLAALAAAGRLDRSPWAACQAAAAVVRANRAGLAGCDVQGWSVVVSARVDPVLPLLPPVEATARAGFPTRARVVPP